MLQRICVLSAFVLSVFTGTLWNSHASAMAEEADLMPVMAPYSGAQSYELKGSWIMTIVFRTTPEILRELVPKPLIPNPAGFMFLMISRFPGKGNEMALGVPAAFKSRSVNYCLYAVADSDDAVITGREVWGFPKKMGRVALEERDGKVIGIYLKAE